MKNSIIGTNSTIVCRNNIGEFAFIGAGYLVTKEVKPYALQIGNPAKQIGWVSEFGYKLKFNDVCKAICWESKQEFRLEGNEVIRIN